MFTAPDLYVPQAATLSELNAWLAADLNAAYARLYVNAHAFRPIDSPHDYTEASFPGYAPVNPIVWGPVGINGFGKAQVQAETCFWKLASRNGAYTVYGCLITDVAYAVLYGVLPFFQPVVLSRFNPTISLAPSVTVTGELGGQ